MDAGEVDPEGVGLKVTRLLVGHSDIIFSRETQRVKQHAPCYPGSRPGKAAPCCAAPRRAVPPAGLPVTGRLPGAGHCKKNNLQSTKLGYNGLK